MFNGNTLEQSDDLGQPIVDDSFLILVNSSHDAINYVLPLSPGNRGWKVVMDTSDLEHPFRNGPKEERFEVHGRSVVLMRELTAEEAGHMTTETAAVAEEFADALAPGEQDAVPEMADPLPVD